MKLVEECGAGCPVRCFLLPYRAKYIGTFFTQVWTQFLTVGTGTDRSTPVRKVGPHEEGIFRSTVRGAWYRFGHDVATRGVEIVDGGVRYGLLIDLWGLGGVSHDAT